MKKEDAAKLKTGEKAEFCWMGKVLNGTIEQIRKSEFSVKTQDGKIYTVPSGRIEKPGTIEKQWAAPKL